MNLVLGVTVGASAVRLARPGTLDHSGPVFRSRAIARGHEIPEDIAADSIRIALAEFTGKDNSVAVVYRDQNQAGALTNALDRGLIDNYRLVPESTAILRMLEEPGTLGSQNTLVVVDLGSTGTSIDVVDRPSGSTVVAARSSQVSGDHFDSLVYRDQTERRRIAPPSDAQSLIELQVRCQLAKEQLSTRSAVCLPGPGGLLLLSREVFDSLIAPSVEALAREVREVVAMSGRRPDALVLIGGGARVPLIRAVLEMWLEVPVIAPDQPDLLATQGAALLAEGASSQDASPQPAPVAVAPASVAPIFAPYPIHTPAVVPEPVEAFAHGGLAVPPASDGPEANTSAMVNAPAYSAVQEDFGGGQPSWLTSAVHDEKATENPRKQIRFAGLGAGVVAAMAIVGLGLGYGGKVFGVSSETGPVATEVTTTSTPETTVAPVITIPPPPSATETTTTPPPVVEEAPVTQAPYVEPYVAPAPPPPALYIPGLPPILLPVLPIPGL